MRRWRSCWRCWVVLMGLWGSRVSLLGQVSMFWQMQWLSMMPAIFKGIGISHLAQSTISQVPVRSWARSISLSSR